MTSAVSTAGTVTPVPHPPTPLPRITPSLPTAIHLEPASGPPGTIVRIQGYLPGGPTATNAATSSGPTIATICWAGCRDGIRSAATPVEWSSSEPGHFTLQFQVPRAPWNVGGATHPLAPGAYEVDVLCLPPFSGCANEAPDARATFTLTGPAVAACSAGPCAAIQVSPVSGPAGTMVEVRGWAPLIQLATTGGGDEGGHLLLSLRPDPLRPEGGVGLPTLQQAPSGDFVGQFRVGTLSPGRYTVVAEAVEQGQGISVASVEFEVTASPTWSSLGPLHPLWIEGGGALAPWIAGDQSVPGSIAYCLPGWVRLTTDGGRSWSEFPINDVVRLLAPTDYQPTRVPPLCQAAVQDPTHPMSIYALFPVYRKPSALYGASQINLFSSDGGQTWHFVPPPGGYTSFDAGGFQLEGKAVYATFGQPAQFTGIPPNLAVEKSGDGGRTWQAATLPCPASGPCVRWGPIPSQVAASCRSPGFLHAILFSSDHGATWTTRPALPGTQACNFAQLVALSPTTIAVVDGGSEKDGDFPLRVSRDNGLTWSVIDVPPIPGGIPSGLQPESLWMLPDGSLLRPWSFSPSASSSWSRLYPGAAAWCGLAPNPLPATFPNVTTFNVVGDRLWWIGGVWDPISALSFGSVRPGDLHCTSA